MENGSGSAIPSDDLQAPATQPSYARRGALIGSSLGLLAVWCIMLGVIDPTVTEHSPIFPTAVVIVCVFAVFVWLMLTLIGHGIGSRMRNWSVTGPLSFGVRLTHSNPAMRSVTHGFAPVRLLGDPDEDRDRIFVELWDTKDWPDVLAHLERLRGVSCLTSLQANPDAAGLTFTFGGHRFSFYRACGEYVGLVEDPRCPDEVLLRVAHHMNNLLCPITTYRFWHQWRR
jgi:hypothetical protein